MKTYVTFILLFLSLISLAQENQEVIITGRGIDCKAAEKDAYEKGLAQGGGAYYASNKEMINRQLVSESIEVLKTGNVLSATALTPCNKAIDGSFEIVMRIMVSQTELKKFVEGKGKAVGYSGETMVRKKRTEEQAEVNELNVIKNVLRQLENLSSDPFDFFWEPGQPKFLPSSKVDMPGKVIVQYNQNYYNIGQKLIGELNDIALKPADIEFRKQYLDKQNISIEINGNTYNLRNVLSKSELLNFYKTLNAKQDDYIIRDGTNNNLTLQNKVEKIIQISQIGSMTYPYQGSVFKEINGSIILSEIEAEKLNRIIIFSKQREKQINQNTMNSDDLMLYYYSETNPLEFSKLRGRFEETIENIANERTVGKINFEYKIHFTQTGKNNSKLINKDGFGSVFQFQLEEAIAKANISPSMIGEKYTKSKDSILVDLEWKTSKEKIRYTASNQSLSNNFKALNLPYGSYETNLKVKELNGLIFYDQRILKYKTEGSINAVNSMILPGWGTRKVTYNEKTGWGRFAIFAIPILTSLTFEMMSRNNFNNYRQTDISLNNNIANTYYNRANTQRRASLISAGIGVTVYIFDIFWVLNKGSKNKINEKKINELINQEKGIYLRKQPLKF